MRNKRLTRSSAVLGTFMLLVSIGSSAAFAETIWPTEQWQTSSPEEQGMESAALAKLLQFGASRSFDSLLLVRHGRIVLDAYYAPYSAEIPHVINSATKAVVGTLAGIAVKDGLLDSPDHAMLDFFADRTIANLDDKKKAITVQHLLDMTSGIDWDEGVEGGAAQTLQEFGRSRDLVKFVLDRPMSKPPGEAFNYDSGNPHLLSAILTRLTGLSGRDYAIARLFGPLGIAPPSWPHDEQGISIGGGMLALPPRDMAKLGYLYLHDGQWDDKRLLPPGWADRVSHASVNMNASFDPQLRYANFFWALPDKHVTMAVGDRCQLIMVFSELDLVAVTTARDHCPFGKLADQIAGAVKSATALPADPAGATLLADEIRNISTEKPTEVGAVSETASAISAKTYKFPDNALNVKSLSLSLADPSPHYELEIYNRYQENSSLKFYGPIGLDGLYRQGETTALGVIALKGTWSDGHTFVIDHRLLGGDDDGKWTLSFDGDKANLRGKSRDGRDVSVDGGTGRQR